MEHQRASPRSGARRRSVEAGDDGCCRVSHQRADDGGCDRMWRGGAMCVVELEWSGAG